MIFVNYSCIKEQRGVIVYISTIEFNIFFTNNFIFFFPLIFSDENVTIKKKTERIPMKIVNFHNVWNFHFGSIRLSWCVHVNLTQLI